MPAARDSCPPPGGRIIRDFSAPGVQCKFGLTGPAAAGPSPFQPRQVLVVTAGPAGAAGLRSLRFLPLLAGSQLRASDLPAPSEDDVDRAVGSYKAFRLSSLTLGTAEDTGFDTLPPQPAIDQASRKAAANALAQINGDCRHLRAFLKAVVRQGARLTWDILVPSSRAWQAFANDCVLASPVASLKAYATILNKLSAQLALQLGPTHPLRDILTANGGHPWNSEAIAPISKRYKDSRASDKLVAANAAVAAFDATGEPAKSAPKEHKALPVPVYLLSSWLSAATRAIAAHEATRKRLKAASSPPGVRRSTRRSSSELSPASAAFLKAQAAQALEAVSKATAELAVLDAEGAGYAVLFLQLLTMSRASSLTAGRESEGPGIRSDVRFNSSGLSYCIRFVKGWDSTSSFFGEKLPLYFTSIPWGRPGDRFPCAPRQAMMEVIQYAKNEFKSLDRFDCAYPERDGSGLLNSFLDSIGATQSLSSTDAQRGGLNQHVSSHSVRKAGVNLGLAGEVAPDTIRRWTRWRDADMLWQYAASDYPVPAEWLALFAWLAPSCGLSGPVHTRPRSPA